MDYQAERINKEYMHKIALDKGKYSASLDKDKKDRANEAGMNDYDYLLAKSQGVHLEAAGKKYGGKWTRRHEGGSIRQEPLETEASKAGRTLDQFIDEE